MRDAFALARRFELLAGQVTLPRPRPRVIAPGFPGHRDWHPPGSPPPVPDVFRYDRLGRRIPDTPEHRARVREKLAFAREEQARMKRCRGAPRP